MHMGRGRQSRTLRTQRIHWVDCGPKLRQSEVGHSSVKGEKGMSRKAKRKCERRPATFKQMAVERMKEGHIRELAKELGVPVSGLYRWKQLAEGRAAPGADAAEDP